MNAKTKKVLSTIGNILMWLFVAFAVLITVLVISSTQSDNGIASIGGRSFINILTDSMQNDEPGKPTINPGDMIIITLLTPEEKALCKENEIITFYADLDGNGQRELNTHRIVSVREANEYVYYTTRGDNPQIVKNDDDEVVSTDVIGVYNENAGDRIVGLGAVMGFLQSSLGFLLIIVLPLLIFFIFELINFIRTLTKVRAKENLSAEDREEIKRRAVEEYLRQQQQEAQQNNQTPDNGENKSADGSNDGDGGAQ